MAKRKTTSTRSTRPRKVKGTFPSPESVAAWLAGSDWTSDKPYAPPPYPYRTSPWVHKAISTVAQALASVPVVVTTRDGDVIESGELVDSLSSLTNMQGAYGLVHQIVGEYLLTGEAHVVFDLVSPGAGTVDVLGAYSMGALVSEDGQTLLGWMAELAGRNGEIKKYPLDLRSVASWIDQNLYPGTKFRGLSRLESLNTTLSEDDASGKHNATLLTRGGGPKGLLKTEQSLTPQQARELEERWESKYAGATNTGKTAVLGRGTEWQTMAQSNKDLLLLDIRKVTRETILALFDVPPAIAGVQVSGTSESGAHDSSTREGWYVNSIWPLAQRVSDLLTRAFVPRYGTQGRRGYKVRGSPSFAMARRAMGNGSDVMIWLDMGQIPGLRSWHQQQADAALKWIEAGVPLNEIIEKHDLPYEPVPWGDVAWMDKTRLPADVLMSHADELASPPKPSPLPGAPPKDDDEMPPDKTPNPMQEGFNRLAHLAAKAQADAIWGDWVDSWSGLERKTKTAFGRYFFRQRAECLQRLDAHPPHAKGADPAVTRAWVDDLLPDVVKENELLVDLASPLLKAGLELGGEQIADEMGGVNPFKLPDVHWPEYLGERFDKLTGSINVTTYDALRTTLNEGHDVGETVTELAKRIKDVFREANDSRALTIARTETAMSVSQGRAATMKENGVEYKAWITAGDEYVRDAHVQAGIDYARGIQVGESFIVDGEALDHPSDPGGSAGNIINCRCVAIATDAPTPTTSYTDALAAYRARPFVRYQEADHDSES